MYIPKNRIKTNLYTRGDEYKNIRTGEEYIGYYWSMYNGTIYTGKNPNEKPSEQLIKIETTENIDRLESQDQVFQQYAENYDSEVIPGQYQNMDDVNIYNNINKVNTSATQLLPQQFYPFPTDEDYNNGFLMRYFAVKVNEISFLEINKETYNKMKSQDTTYLYQLYDIFKLQWTLIGDVGLVSQANLSIVESLETKLKKNGLKEFLNQNFLEFWGGGIQTNLSTDGTEFLIRGTETPYSGLYHIHPKFGPMVGADHVSTPHDYLDPIINSNSRILF